MRWKNPTPRFLAHVLLARKFLTRVLLVPLMLLSPALVSAEGEEEQAAPPPPCSAPEFSQFDFWVGEWNASWGEKGHGTNTITREYDGCVIREQFETETFRGTSLSTWSPKLGVWRQTWVDNSGGYLDFVGGMDGDRMVLSREATENPDVTHLRMVFHDITDDSFVWDWEMSEDGGETWTMTWQIQYTRKESAASASVD